MYCKIAPKVASFKIKAEADVYLFRTIFWKILLWKQPTGQFSIKASHVYYGLISRSSLKSTLAYMNVNICELLNTYIRAKTFFGLRYHTQTTDRIQVLPVLANSHQLERLFVKDLSDFSDLLSLQFGVHRNPTSQILVGAGALKLCSV